MGDAVLGRVDIFQLDRSLFMLVVVLGEEKLQDAAGRHTEESTLAGIRVPRWEPRDYRILVLVCAPLANGRATDDMILLPKR